MTEDKRAISPPLPPEPSQGYPIPHMSPTQDSPSDPGRMQEKITNPSAAAGPGAEDTMAGIYRMDSKRSASVSNPKVRSPRPISDVVNDAFQDSPAKTHMDAEMIKMISAQVTEQVMKNLAQQQAAGTNPLAPSQQHSPQSATQSTFDALPAQSAPVTPEVGRYPRDAGRASPEYQPLDARSQYSQRSEERERSPEATQRREGARPTAAKPDSSNARRAPAQASTGNPLQRSDSQYGGPATPKSPSRIDSKLSDTGYDNAAKNAPKKKPADRAPDNEETALERAWQPLFINGNPTARLSSFLRGLALHIVDDYDPKGSLVIGPSKMLRFFNEAKVDEEHYPWHMIFSKLTHVSLSNLYRKMNCPHHLVQKTYQDPPVIPALTPWGFEYFMTCLIQAHPDTEFDRLAKAVMNMPISSADDPSHRFPKELSRRLLPAEPNIQAQQKLVWSMNHEPSVIGELKGKVAMPPPPASTPPGQPSTFTSTSLPERQRQPYSKPAQQRSAFVEDDDLNQPSIPIERERKPYTAREGTGKVHAAEDSRPPLNQYSKTDSGATRHSRSNSGVPTQAMYPPQTGPSDPVTIPPRNQHRQSVGQNSMPQTLNGGYPRPVRGRSSPPNRNAFVNSDPLNVGSMPEQQYMSNLHPSQSSPNTGPPHMYNDDGYRQPQPQQPQQQQQYRPDRPTNNNNNNNTNNTAGSDAGRGYPIPPPNRPPTAPATSFDFPAGSMGGPVGDGPPFPSRRPMPPPPNHNPPMDRRRSVYAPSNHANANAKANSTGSDPGVEGYGSSYTDKNGGGMNGGGGYPPPQQQQQYGSGGSSSQY